MFYFDSLIWGQSSFFGRSGYKQTFFLPSSLFGSEQGMTVLI